MSKFVYVTVYHRIDVEANSAEEAKELAKEEIWDDHIKDVIIDVEEVDSDNSELTRVCRTSGRDDGKVFLTGDTFCVSQSSHRGHA